MRGINKVFILGNLGNTPELRTTPTGKVVCELSMATNRRYKQADGQYADDTQWHKVTCWERDAEIAQRFLVKGSPVAVEGRLKTDSWEDKQSGQRRYKTTIVCERLHLLGARVGESGSRETPPRHAPVAEEEVPF